MKKQGKTSALNVAAVCRRLGMSRQNYYAARKVREKREVECGEWTRFVRGERARHPRMGVRKLLHRYKQALPESGKPPGRDRAFSDLRDCNLLVPRKKGRPRTTCSKHNLPLYTNQVKDREANEANQIWVSDVTWIDTLEGPLYLSLTTDGGSRKIVGHHASDDLKTEGCLRTLNQAQSALPAGHSPIHHSDRGSQYASHAHTGRFEELGLTVSMTEKDHCAENALAERMNGILKGEYELDTSFATKAQARGAIAQAVKLYNEERPHSALDYQTPAQWHRESEERTRSRWSPAPLRRATPASATRGSNG